MNKKIILSKILNTYLFESLQLKSMSQGKPILKIINFHRVLDDNTPKDDYRYLAGHPTKKSFSNLIKHIKSKYNPICLNEFSKHGNSLLSKKKINIAITFDDGYKDNLINALPVLENLNVPASIFCTTNTLDGGYLWFQDLYLRVEQLTDNEIELPWFTNKINLDNKWRAMELIANSCKDLSYKETIDRIKLIKDKPTDFKKEEMILWKDLPQLTDSKLITIGAHTKIHWNLTKLTDIELKEELEIPLKRLCDYLNKTDIMIAYPNGRFNQKVLKAVNTAGYANGFIMERGKIKTETSNFALFREYVETNIPLFDFQMFDFDILINNLFRR